MAVPMSGAIDEKRVFVADTRRRWSLDEKLSMVAETEAAPVSRVARKHGVAPGLLFRWRKTLGKRPAPSSQWRGRSETGFIPIALPAPLAPQDAVCGIARDGVIEIMLAGNRRVIVRKDFDAELLRRVIEALEPR